MPRERNEISYARQEGLVEPSIADKDIHIVGIGAVGRPVALQLYAMGAQHLTLIDPDHIDNVNLHTQGWAHQHVGAEKVYAAGEDMVRITGNPLDHVIYCPNRWAKEYAEQAPEVVFLCVDNIKSRGEIAAAYAARNPNVLLIDGRMRGEAGYVFSAWDAETHDTYKQSIFPEEETQEGRCTSQATIYCATFVAAAMIQIFTRWLRGAPILPCLGGSAMEWMPVDMRPLADADQPAEEIQEEQPAEAPTLSGPVVAS